MDYSYLSPYVRVAMDSIISPPWYLAPRDIFDYELLFIKEGHVKITIEEENYEGRAGDIFLFKPRQKHSIKIIGEVPFRQPHLHFDLIYQEDSPQVKVSFKAYKHMTGEERRYFRENELLELPNKLSVRNLGYFEEMLFEIIEEFQDRMPLYEINIKGLFIKLWTYILREYHYGNDEVINCRMDELKHIREYIRSHAEEELSLELLAENFHISKYHLIRLFKKTFGDTPMHYHSLLRIEKAKEKIQFTNLCLMDIATTVGFENINTFSRAFRKIEGVPPSFYRGRK